MCSFLLSYVLFGRLDYLDKRFRDGAEFCLNYGPDPSSRVESSGMTEWDVLPSIPKLNKQMLTAQTQRKRP